MTDNAPPRGIIPSCIKRKKHLSLVDADGGVEDKEAASANRPYPSDIRHLSLLLATADNPAGVRMFRVVTREGYSSVATEGRISPME